MESYDLDPVLLRSARVADALHRIALLFVGATVLLSPVFFASKEMWWFWPMVGLLSLGCLFCGAATLVESSFLHDQDSPVRRHRIPARMFGALALCAPMLAYAILRAQFPSAPGFPLVDMDATRSVLLFWTPAALALVLTLSSRRRGRATLLRLVLLETFLLAAYGVWNHFHSRDMNVLWVVPNEFYDFTYAGRISATFFCPNHFSAWLDIAICLLLGGALAPGGRRRERLLCALGALVLLPVDILTLSRGGVGALFAGLFILVPLIGLRGRRPLVRILAAVALAALAVGGAYAVRYAAWTHESSLSKLESVRFGAGRAAETAVGPKTILSYEKDGAFRVRGDKGRAESVPAAELLPVSFGPSAATNEAGRFAVQVKYAKDRHVDYAEPFGIDEAGTLRYRAYNPLMNRMKGHPFWGLWERAGSWADIREKASDVFWYRFDRGQYIGAALRAWRSNPTWGIGPGQNQHRWPQFAASEDGVRAEPGHPETLKKPRLMNDYYHLYEVHSDWVQLLEEYGVVGFALFCFAYVGIAVLLLRRQGAILEDGEGLRALDRGLPLGVLLAAGVVSIQCTLDFSMQMPCIAWLFGFLVAAALLAPRKA